MRALKDDLYSQIIDDTAELVRRAAHPQKGTIALSPETAALLERIGVRPSMDLAAVAESPGDGVAALTALAEEVSECTKCDLCQSHTQTVFSDTSGGVLATQDWVEKAMYRRRGEAPPTLQPSATDELQHAER